MSNFLPTPEQQDIVTAATTGEHVVVEAGAGTGKTSTLCLIAEALKGRSILYLAFSKALQVEAAGKFPEHVEARTAHSLAYRSYGAPNKHRMGKFAKARDLIALLGIKAFTYELSDEKLTLEPWQIASLVKDAIGKFCCSADREPSAHHIPYNVVPREAYELLVAHALPYVQAAWTQISDPSSSFPFIPGRGDGCYLKMWSLSDPQLPYDVILFDEAQDADPAIAHVVDIQEGAQKILVGDRAQAIYGWRGAVDAMSNFKAPHHLFLTQSFRFGDAVAQVANKWLTRIGTPLRLTGTDTIQSEVGPLATPSCILCRTNAGVIESAMNAQANGQSVAIVGGTKDIEAFVRAADDLMSGQRASLPQLMSYRTWDEVCAAVENGDDDGIGVMVRLVNNYGVAAILEVCNTSTKPEWADVLVSTAHKAKGLEWDSVRIHSDFKAPKDTLSISEAMLIYVAVTRAKRLLDDGALAWLEEFESTIDEEV